MAKHALHKTHEVPVYITSYEPCQADGNPYMVTINKTLCNERAYFRYVSSLTMKIENNPMPLQLTWNLCIEHSHRMIHLFASEITKGLLEMTPLDDNVVETTTIITTATTTTVTPPTQMLTMRCNNCMTTVRVGRVINGGVGSFAWCPFCGKQAATLIDPNEDWWEAVATALNVNVPIAHMCWDAWQEANVQLNFMKWARIWLAELDNDADFDFDFDTDEEPSDGISDAR